MNRKAELFYSVLAHAAWAVAVLLKGYRHGSMDVWGYMLLAGNVVSGSYALIYFYFNPRAFFLLSRQRKEVDFIFQPEISKNLRAIFFLFGWLYVVVLVLGGIFFAPILSPWIMSYWFIFGLVTIRMISRYLSLQSLGLAKK